MRGGVLPSPNYADWPSKPGAVYFIGAGRPTIAIKIGVTQRDKVGRRLREIQCNNHEPVEVLGLILFEEGNTPLLEAEKREHLLHGLFARHQQIVDGNVGHEWFTAASEILDYIAEHAIAPEQVGSPRSVAKIAGTAP